MEFLTFDEKIKRFLESGYGYGSGSGDSSGSGDGFGYGSGSGSGDGYGDGSGYSSGDGFGYGDGYGDGYGSGYGDGDGFGYGSGYGDGYGDGSGINEFDGYKLYEIDGIKTAITAVHDNYAVGFTIKNNCEKVNCYIVNCNGYYAHGDTLKKAYDDAMEKYNDNMSIKEKIRMFLDFCKDKQTIPATDLIRWHHTLTGSCEMGRRQFCERHNIDINNDVFTLAEFIQLTENEYGGHIIKQLNQNNK